MLDRPDTELLGLRGLFLEASRSNDTDAARALAEQAVKRDPRLAWGVNALFDMQARGGDYEGALDTLAIARFERLSAIVDLMQSLGGGWVEEPSAQG